MTDQLADGDGSQNIFCPDETCSPERDWIVMDLEPGVLLPLGAVYLIAGVVSLFMYRHEGSLMYEKNGISLSVLMLGISILLRAAVGLRTDHKEALYVASMIFGFHSGQCIYSKLFVNSFCMDMPWEHAKKGRVNMVVGTNQTLGIFVVALCGAVLMFHPTTNSHAGMTCFRVVLAIMLIMTLVMIGIFVYRLKMLHWHITTRNLTSSVIVFVLLVFWCGFMLARTFVGLASPARSSLGMFVWFNYIPLCLCFIFARALGEPLTFDSNHSQPLSACQNMELVGLEHGRSVAENSRDSDPAL